MEENKDEEILNAQEEETSEEAEAEETVAAEETEEAAETEESAEAEEAAEDSDSKSAELEKRYMSLYAEYDNYRKRTQKEKENLYADAVADVAKEFLAVIDNIDRAVATAKDADENSVAKVIEGIELLGKYKGKVIRHVVVQVAN